MTSNRNEPTASASSLNESTLNTLLENTFLRSVRYFAETDSTNSRANDLIAGELPLATPLLVYAQSQTAGRGRGDNRWWSKPGSLTFSIVIDADEFGLTPEQLIKLPLITGMAVLRCGQSIIAESGNVKDDFALKWPNDVYLAGRKLAGILIEVPAATSSADASPPRHAVIGVGLNVNNSWLDAPDDIRTVGISLADYCDKKLDRLSVLKKFLSHLETLIQSLAAGKPVLEDWSAHCLLTGKKVTLIVGDEEITGDCQGLAHNGALLLQTSNGLQQFLGGIVKSWQ